MNSGEELTGAPERASATRRAGRSVTNSGAGTFDVGSFALGNSFASLTSAARPNGHLRQLLDSFTQPAEFTNQIRQIADVARASPISISSAAALSAASASIAARYSEPVVPLASQPALSSLIASLQTPARSALANLPDFERLGADVFKRYAAFSRVEAIRIPDLAGPAINARLDGLRLGFAQQLGGEADVFGRLDEAVRAVPRLALALNDLISTTQHRGPIGFNYSGVYAAMGRVDDLLADDEVEKSIVGPLDDLQQVTGLEDEDMIHLPDVMGFLHGLRRMRLSTVGVFCGFTVGTLFWVFDVVSGTSMPVAGINSFIIGAGVYDFARRRDSAND